MPQLRFHLLQRYQSDVTSELMGGGFLSKRCAAAHLHNYLLGDLHWPIGE